MNYKVAGALKNNKKNLIIYIILWFFITLIFISPLTYSYVSATVQGDFDLSIFIERFGQSIVHPFKALGILAKDGFIGSYFKALFFFTLIYVVITIIGLVRTAPESEYSNIEHGSSDWCQGGEQYRVLSKNKGIILAEDNYLPVNKRGNVNVLVVGRIRFW